MKILFRTLAVLAVVAMSGLIDHGQALAAPKHLFKIASLAPEGSVWVNQFEKFASEVSEKTGGEVGFRIYAGGIMGDDQAMYRKMRVGQLHGGGFTMTGIAGVVPDFRVMSLPFIFNNYKEVDAVSNGLEPIFIDQFRAQGMEFIAMTEVGFIYTMATRPMTTTGDLKKATIWIPAGDPLASAFIGAVGLSPVQLSIPDVLSSLQTGLVDTVFNSLYGSIVLQWFTKAKYITDNPFGYAYGVFLLDKKKFDKLSPAHAEIIRQAADKHFKVLIDETRKSNDQSLQVLKKQGVTFVKADEESMRELTAYRQQTIDATIGKDYSREIFNMMIDLLEKYRASGTSK
jgi:TRAP-type transport system periplasmic protein